MGYTNLTDICQLVSPGEMMKTQGTWTPGESSGVVGEERSAADDAFELLIPLKLPGSAVGVQGAKILSIDVWYKVATAALTSFNTVEVVKTSLSANGSAMTGETIPTSVDADNDTSAERVTVDEHKMTITITTPVFIQDDEAWYVHLGADPAAGSVFTLYGAQVNFELRL
jgi:hypothetical protein